MRDDLIFHVTTKKYLKNHTVNNRYEPESIDTEGFIHCSSGGQVEETANRIFSDKEKILLLIIDVTALSTEIKYDLDENTGEKYPHIYGPLNTDAIIDKFNIFAEKDGKFSIEFSSTT